MRSPANGLRSCSQGCQANPATDRASFCIFTNVGIQDLTHRGEQFDCLGPEFHPLDTPQYPFSLGS